MSYQVKKLGDQHLHYIIKTLKKGRFDILHDISENIKLVQLMDTQGNVNNAVSIFIYWIFDPNYKKGAFLDTIFIEYHMIYFDRIRNICHV